MLWVVKHIIWGACEKRHGGWFHVTVDFINQLSIEPPELSALIYSVFYHQRAGWAHRLPGSLPDTTTALVWLVWQDSKINTPCVSGTISISSSQVHADSLQYNRPLCAHHTTNITKFLTEAPSGIPSAGKIGHVCQGKTKESSGSKKEVPHFFETFCFSLTSSH